MTRARIIPLAIILLVWGCAVARWYADSFKGPPARHDLVVPPKIVYDANGTRIEILILYGESPGYCLWTAAGITCDFGVQRLYEDARYTGGWRFLIPDDARRLCWNAMFALTTMDAYGRVTRAQPTTVDACAMALMELRFRELRPPDGDEL